MGPRGNGFLGFGKILHCYDEGRRYAIGHELEQEWSEMGDIFFSRLIFPPLRGGIHPQLDQTNMLKAQPTLVL